jgi:hypothetical protein
MEADDGRRADDAANTNVTAGADDPAPSHQV